MSGCRTSKRNITLPPVHNIRSPAQWDIISQHVDFNGKTVLDLGCGHGDLLWRAWAIGAKYCWGADKSESTIENNKSNQTEVCNHNFLFIHSRIEKWVQGDGYPQPRHDIIICFSVLPYLADPLAVLHWIRDHSTQSLIECQYAGDGPGFGWLKDDYDMRRWLDQAKFDMIEPIGKTFVECRDIYRTIWLCQ